MHVNYYLAEQNFWAPYHLGSQAPRGPPGIRAPYRREAMTIKRPLIAGEVSLGILCCDGETVLEGKIWTVSDPEVLSLWALPTFCKLSVVVLSSERGCVADAVALLRGISGVEQWLAQFAARRNHCGRRNTPAESKRAGGRKPTKFDN